MKKLSEILNKYMSDKNLTQTKLSEKSGVNKASISYILSGKQGARPDTVLKLAGALGLSTEETEDLMLIAMTPKSSEPVSATITGIIDGREKPFRELAEDPAPYPETPRPKDQGATLIKPERLAKCIKFVYQMAEINDRKPSVDDIARCSAGIYEKWGLYEDGKLSKTEIIKWVEKSL